MFQNHKSEKCIINTTLELNKQLKTNDTFNAYRIIGFYYYLIEFFDTVYPLMPFGVLKQHHFGLLINGDEQYHHLK